METLDQYSLKVLSVGCSTIILNVMFFLFFVIPHHPYNIVQSVYGKIPEIPLFLGLNTLNR